MPDLKVKLQSQTFDQQSVVETTLSDLKQAELTKDRDEQLLKLNLKTDMDVKLSVAKWEKLVGKYKIEKQKLDILKQSVDAQLDSQKVQIEKLQGPVEAQEEAGGRADDPRRHRRPHAGDDACKWARG